MVNMVGSWILNARAYAAITELFFRFSDQCHGPVFWRARAIKS